MDAPAWSILAVTSTKAASEEMRVGVCKALGEKIAEEVGNSCFLCLSVSLCLSLSLPVSLCLSLSFSPSLSLAVSVCRSVSLSLSVSLSSSSCLAP